MLAAETKVAGSHSERAPDAESACSWKRIMEPVEPFLDAVTQQLMRQARDFDPQIVPYADHALNHGGKHLRPALVALAAGCFGRPTEAHVKAAVIIEMIHLATLVHDDVMDEAEIRRGQPDRGGQMGERNRRPVRRLPVCARVDAGGQFSDHGSLPGGFAGHEHGVFG